MLSSLFLTMPLAMSAQEELDEDNMDVEDITLPDALGAELDSLLQEWNNKSYLIPEGDCTDNGVNPEFDNETYIHRLQRLPNVIEMPYNDIVRMCIDRYMGRLRRTVSIILGASNFYTPIFEEALEAYQLPLELKYLPVIESALNPNAVSRAGAVGLWQFMITTGKQYGLEVTSLIDERRDPIKSSYAAAHFLKDLYDIFGDWTLAIAAYNCGPENVNKAIRRSGGAMDYWKIYPYLPSETRGYVPAFIAANYVMTYYCDHNICPMLTTLPEHTDTVVVNHNVSLSSISKFCDIDINMLRELNPQYRRDLVNGSTEPSTIRMTIPSMNKFLELQDTIFSYDAAHVGGKHAYAAVEEKGSSRSEAEEAAKKVAEIEKKLSREQRTELENEISDIQELRDEYKRLLETMLSYEKSKKQKDAEKIADLEGRLAEADAVAEKRIAIAEAKAKRKFDKEVKELQEGFDETAEDIARSRAEGETDRKVEATLKDDAAAGMKLLADLIGQSKVAAAQAKAEFDKAMAEATADGDVSDEEKDRIRKAQDAYSLAERLVDKYAAKLCSAQDETQKRAGATKPQGAFYARAASALRGNQMEQRMLTATQEIEKHTKKAAELLKGMDGGGTMTFQ